jgi:hypothetical protein
VNKMFLAMTHVLLKMGEYLRKTRTFEVFLVGVGKHRDEKFVVLALKFGISEGITQ